MKQALEQVCSRVVAQTWNQVLNQVSIDDEQYCERYVIEQVHEQVLQTIWNVILESWIISNSILESSNEAGI